MLDGESPYTLSDVLDLGPGAEGVIAFAQTVETESGDIRVLVNGFPPELLSVFIGGYLAQVPNVEGGHAYALDSEGKVVASSDPDIRSGAARPRRPG